VEVGLCVYIYIYMGNFQKWGPVIKCVFKIAVSPKLFNIF
jgi:hypothetical protein